MSDSAETIIPLDGSSVWLGEPSTRKASSTLGKDDFLNLLVAQMKYQNPLEPMSNTESIAQLAQFSALEQMTNIATAQNKAAAYSLIGKYVAGNLYSETTGVNEVVSGMVDSVKISNGEAFLRIGEVELPLSGLTNVTDSNIDALANINANIASSQSLALIGKNVQAVMTDAEGNVVKFVEGTVDYVKVAGGRTILMVNDLEIFAEEVLLISDEKKLIGKQATGITINEDKSETPYTGIISGIDFVDNKPYLVIGDKKFAINTISDVTEALNLLGKYADITDVRGIVTDVVVKNGEVYTRIDGTDVSLEVVKKAMEGEGRITAVDDPDKQKPPEKEEEEEEIPEEIPEIPNAPNIPEQQEEIPAEIPEQPEDTPPVVPEQPADVSEETDDVTEEAPDEQPEEVSEEPPAE